MDHTYYLAMAYAAAAVAIAVELVALRMGRTRARGLIEEERDLEAQD